MAVNFRIGGVYTFTTINSNILGGTFEKAKLSGIVDYQAAKLINPNIDSVQASVSPYLPSTASKKHTSYQYYIFQKQTDGVVIFALEWINTDTVTENSIEYLDIRITGANASNISAIKNILGLSGWPIVNAIT